MRIIVVILILLLGAPGIAAQGIRYRIGVNYGLGNISAPDTPRFTFNHQWGFLAGIQGEKFSLDFSFRTGTNYSDSSASGNFNFFSEKKGATYAFKTLRLGFDGDYRLTQGSIRPTIGAGIGYMVWKYKDPAADSVLKGTDDKDITTDLSAAEMYLAASLGVEIRPSPHWAMHLRGGIDYLTGIGTSFSDNTNDFRGRTALRSLFSLVYIFGMPERRQRISPGWQSEDVWEETPVARPDPSERDGDGDGVPDKYDKCESTPPGAEVDKKGCPFDSDNDGVFDGLDDCPRTPARAAGLVDIFGCPIDSDYDGVPDYEDNCNNGPVGALVDSSGCPLDGDGDGVYDGLDDCPHTQAGIDVDERGCMDISFLHEPMVINIDYEPGSFEIDPRTRERLAPLVKKLFILPDVKVTIVGYTDNIGPAEANLEVSKKRANRMRDWLVGQGIDEKRLTPMGRGETNFIASNQTAEGRAKNRRIELVFEK